jgi:hypothetical protein
LEIFRFLDARSEELKRLSAKPIFFMLIQTEDTPPLFAGVSREVIDK